MPATQPSATDYLHACEAVYYPDHPEMAVHAQLKPFLDRNGTPLTVNRGGTIGVAYADSGGNIIIAFQDTNMNAPFAAASRSQLEADLRIRAGVRPKEFDFANGFARSVINEAGRQQIDRSRVFVTGHSLGGAEAEFVAQQNKLGGKSFGAPGKPNQSVGNPAFISHVAYGDPVGNYASDTLEQPFAGSSAYHYGKVNMVGRPAHQAGLAGDVATATTARRALARATSIEGIQDAFETMAWAQLHGLTANVGPYHSLDRSYAPALGVVPLPEPQAPRRQAELPPQYGWAAVALLAAASPSGTAIAAAVTERLVRPEGDGSGTALWRAVADKASAPSVPPPAAVATGTTAGTPSSPQAVPPRSSGLRAR